MTNTNLWVCLCLLGLQGTLLELDPELGTWEAIEALCLWDICAVGFGLLRVVISLLFYFLLFRLCFVSCQCGAVL